MRIIESFNHEKQIIITPNHRLSANLLRLYHQYQQKKGFHAWKKPTIIPMTLFIDSLWQEVTTKLFSNSLILLTDTQERILWETIILTSPLCNALLKANETASLAKSAYQLLRQWQVEMDHPLYQINTDYQIFKQWVLTFEQICQEMKFVTFADLPHLITKYIKEKKIIIEKEIIAIGFVELPPQWKELFNACQNANWSQQALIKEPTTCSRITFKDIDSEIRTMARWAKMTLINHPDYRIGCVVPNLNIRRDRIQQLFCEEFAEDNRYTIDIAKSPFNISAGKYLSQYPIIHMALMLLSLYQKTIDIELFSSILISSFVGEAEHERMKRTKLDRILRHKNIRYLNLAEYTAPSEDENLFRITRYCPALAKRLNKFYSLLQSIEPEHSFSEWAIIFNQLLNALGWPGDRSLNSEEFQIVEHWVELLAQLSSLNLLSGIFAQNPGHTINIEVAHQTLSQMAALKAFQAKTPEANIQILGVLEAASLPFDALWVSGLDDISWPAKPNPHPFIPLALQKQLNMPHAHAKRELNFSKDLTQQFATSADEVIFSFASHIHDLEVKPSPLITGYRETTIEDLNIPFTHIRTQTIFKSQKLEEIFDENGPLFSSATLRGGINVLKSQAQCPFKAFAEWRLFAETIDEPLLGFRAKDRGMILHKVLELLWQALKTQQQLKEMNDVDLDILINDCIQQSLIPYTSIHHQKKRYFKLEQIRLSTLIKNWLAVEKERPPFSVIQTEKREIVTVNNLELSIRIDRMDQLADGSILIIDYKSGHKYDVKSWFSDRPEEPQLPLYTLNQSAEFAGICFATINVNKIEYLGVSRDTLNIQGITSYTELKKQPAPSWEDQLHQWQLIFSRLGTDFSSGKACIDPKDTYVCKHCSLKSLCRINEGLLI